MRREKQLQQLKNLTDHASSQTQAQAQTQAQVAPTPTLTPAAATATPTPTPTTYTTTPPVAKSRKSTHRLPKQEVDEEFDDVVDHHYPAEYSAEYPDDHCPLISTYLEAGVLDGGPALPVAINQNPNIYFQHCEYHLYYKHCLGLNIYGVPALLDPLPNSHYATRTPIN